MNQEYHQEAAMFLYILYLTLTTLTFLAINWINPKKLNLYQSIASFLWGLVLIFMIHSNATSALLSGEEPFNFNTYIYILGVFAPFLFLATDYMQFRKNKNSPDAAEKALNKAILSLFVMMMLFLLLLWLN